MPSCVCVHACTWLHGLAHRSPLAFTAEPVISKKPELLPILEKICEPERQIMFRVSVLCQRATPGIVGGNRWLKTCSPAKCDTS